MPLDNRRFDTQRQSAWPWRAGIVVADPQLASGIASALAEVRGPCVFQVSPSASVLEIFALIERDRPDVLFVELAEASLPAMDWMGAVQADGLPLVIAVHPTAAPEQMIEALRAGATEFLSLPLQPAIFDALDRTAARLAAMRSPESETTGRIVGLVSAKGGCGASTLAVHLGMALGSSLAATPEQGKVLIADLDYQASAVHRICAATPRRRAGDTFDSVRRLSSSNWNEFFGPVDPTVDLMAGPEAGTTPPEPWRIESLFRHLTGRYPLVLADLGRHLNPGTWSFLQHIDELLIVAVPDVLALYQTRYILQTLTGRGFEKSRIRLVLNMSQNTPRDFWIESIEQMFEMRIYAVIPSDSSTLAGLPRDRAVFPADSSFGKAVVKLAGRLIKKEDAGSSRRAA